MRRGGALATLALACALALSPAQWARADTRTALVPFEIVQRYAHRTGAFTQGLEIARGQLYESSGLYNQSFVTRWQLDGPTDTDRRQEIASEYFAEGFTVLGDKGYLLTWQSGKGFVLNAQTLQIERSFDYAGEGWGLTNDGRALIMSDGTARLRFLDPETLREQKTLDVTENGRPLADINELEWIDAGPLAPQPRLLANIWRTDQIAVIDPQNGHVTARIDLRPLYPYNKRRSGEDVLNGVAVDPADHTLLVTGKRWRYLWRIRLNAPLP